MLSRHLIWERMPGYSSAPRHGLANEQLLQSPTSRTYASRRSALPNETPAEHINSKIWNDFQIKNKAYPVISRTYFLSNKTIDRPLYILIKSRETIPLSKPSLRCFLYLTNFSFLCFLLFAVYNAMTFLFLKWNRMLQIRHFATENGHTAVKETSNKNPDFCRKLWFLFILTDKLKFCALPPCR
jgi:hypothetical protein